MFEEFVPARSGTIGLERLLVRADGTVEWMSFAITYVPGTADQSDYLMTVATGDL
ncbi:hypothetical protein [Nocardia vaccinii]|uniref:hypothetical protein n=1 Tax=Nocardia vaccinii TaxID=1822 RepID=UPI0012F49F5C|nr:hypothetical protein [Nocardia vaccinii]